MTVGALEIVGRNFREIPICNSIGEALKKVIRDRYANNAAKRIEGDWGLDPKTARNVVTVGHVSERTLTKAVRAEGWDLILALGAELTGETHSQWEERRLNHIIQEAERARKNLVSLRQRREAVEARAADVLDAFDRSMAERVGGTQGRSWAPTPGRSDSAPGPDREG
jgi:hypothetical protein